MTILTLQAMNQGMRCRFTEAEWSAATAGAGHVELPGWAQPLEGADRATDVELDEALSEAIALRGTAIVEVDLAAVGGGRGVLARLWSDGRVGSAVVRGVEVRSQGGTMATRARPGVEVSAFPVERLVDEAMRLVPEAAVTIDATEAIVPQEFTIALAAAVRVGDGRVVEAITGDLGLERVPPVIDAVTRTMDGSLTLTTRSSGRNDDSIGTWLRCSAGWVEIAPAPQGHVRHTPRTVNEIARMLVFDLAGRFDHVLRPPEEGPGDGDVPNGGTSDGAASDGDDAGATIGEPS